MSDILGYYKLSYVCATQPQAELKLNVDILILIWSLLLTSSEISIDFQSPLHSTLLQSGHNDTDHTGIRVVS